jgi:heme/copper-type cytochrome/quinol oxidase subunit 2
MNNQFKKIVAGLLFAGMIGFITTPVTAQQVSLSTTIKNKTFQPSVLKAPANRPITITVHNADGAAAEFESRTMRVEKVVPAGGTIVVNVKPLVPGNYRFFDDFNQSNQGTLVVE